MSPVQFVSEVPGGASPARSISGELENIAKQLKTRPNVWAKVGEKVRSPEKFFPLRDLECEVKVRANGVAKSTRDESVEVQVHDVYARHVPGYKFTPRQQKPKTTANPTPATPADRKLA